MRLNLAEGETLEEALAAYRSREDVEYAEPNPIISICATPSDSLHAEQWALTRIQAQDAWDTCRGSHEVVVALIDTGVDYTHRDLEGNLWVNEAERDGVAGVDDDENGYVDDIYGYNFADDLSDPADDHGHGTHCAGIVAAAGDNGLDVAGVCWTVRLMPLKVLDSDGDGSAADAVPAIYYAVANGADVISGSWGGQEDSRTLREAIAYAHEQGVIVVAAAGNENSDVPYYPAAYPEVLSVAATDAGDRRYYLSNYGDWVDLAAPGRDIVSLRPPGLLWSARHDDFTGRMSGTSMAAPHASGACALLLSANPLLTGEEVERILLATADPTGPGISASNGRVNLYEALRAAIPSEATIHLDRAAYVEGAEISLLLVDWDLRGSGRQAVLVESGHGDAEWLEIEETKASLGVFRGTIASGTGAAAPGDGALQLVHGQSIFAGYLDGGGDSPDSGRWQQAVAVADYEPPVVRELRIEPEPLKAGVTLVTSEPSRIELRYGLVCDGTEERVESSSSLTNEHYIELRGLAAQQRYCLAAILTDEAGNETVADNGGRGYSFIAGEGLSRYRVPAAHPAMQEPTALPRP